MSLSATHHIAASRSWCCCPAQSTPWPNVHPLSRSSLSSLPLPCAEHRYVAPPPEGDRADELKLGPRLGTSAAYDSASRSVVFFGGADPEQTYNDVHILRLGVCAWLVSGPLPAERAAHYAHVACTDTLSPPPLDDLTWAKLEFEGDVPAPRYDHAVAMVNSEMHLFGGASQTGPVTGQAVLDVGT